MKIRLNKYISEAGLCSRREADRKIEQGKVRVNGRAARLGDTVDDSDEVLVDGNPIRNRTQRVYLAYNKPVGVTSTTEHTDPDNIIKAVAYHGGRVFPVGRLDKDSQGLILLTNDGDVVNKILRVSNAHDKEYIVRVDKPVTAEFLKGMSEGVRILGTRTRKCKVEKIGPHDFRIVLQQGLNRQIRRMCKVFDYRVLRLERVRIMHITLDGLASGTWRFLSEEEAFKLMEAVSGSSDGKGAATGSRSDRPLAGMYQQDPGGKRSGRKGSGSGAAAKDASDKKDDRDRGKSSAKPRGRTGGKTAGKSVGKFTGKPDKSDGKSGRPTGKSAGKSTGARQGKSKKSAVGTPRKARPDKAGSPRAKTPASGQGRKR